MKDLCIPWRESVRFTREADTGSGRRGSEWRRRPHTLILNHAQFWRSLMRMRKPFSVCTRSRGRVRPLFVVICILCFALLPQLSRAQPVELIRDERFNEDAVVAIDHLDRKSTRLNSSHVAISYAV